MAATVFRLKENAANGPVHGEREGIPALEKGQLHEIYACMNSRAAALAFALTRNGKAASGAVMLVRTGRRRGSLATINGDGLVLLGIAPARLTIVEADDEVALLRAGLEAARCPGVELVVLETAGRFAGYDLTASRRLALAAERSNACVIVLRHDAVPRPSTARTRWSVGSAASVPFDAGAPGWPAIEVELLHRRGGISGRRWRLEWNRNHETFRDAARPAPISGAVVSLPLVREDAVDRHAHAA